MSFLPWPGWDTGRCEQGDGCPFIHETDEKKEEQIPARVQMIVHQRSTTGARFRFGPGRFGPLKATKE